MGDALIRQLGNAGRRLVNIYDSGEESVVENAAESHRGRQLHLLEKLHPDRKFDAGMAAILSWQAFLKALQSEDLNSTRRSTKVKRLR
jgi:hypothetical protein